MRIKGMTFNGVHCKTHNLVMESSKRPLLAENNDQYVYVPFRDGSILIPDNSKQDVIVEVTFRVLPKSGVNIYDNCRAIANWLSTDARKPLIFDDDLGYTYNAKVTGNIDLERVIDTRNFTVSFRCEPLQKVVGT